MFINAPLLVETPSVQFDLVIVRVRSSALAAMPVPAANPTTSSIANTF